jgi:hypothetical protein
VGRFVAVAVAWLAANLLWIRHDRLLRDGDEEGHIGAAELMLSLLSSEGLPALLWAGMSGDYGEYPPLYAALIGAWWWLSGGGLPGRPAVRLIGLLWPILSAASVSSIAPRGRRLLPFTLVLLVPGVCGLSRHFMPEGALVAAVSVTAALCWHAHRRPSWPVAVLLGLCGGLALLIKQTAILYLLGPALLAAWSLRARGILSAGLCAAVAGPWYITQLTSQRDYLSRSVDAPWSGLDGLAYYPLVGGWSELGPVLLLLLLGGTVAGWRQPVVRYGLAWGGLGLLLLTVTPRKYPRLLAPLLPAAALVAGLGARREALGWASAAGAAAWLTAISTSWTLPEPPLVDAVDDGCLQRWVRPPVPDDLGLSAVAAAVRASQPQRVGVIAGPQIPCTIQTTHRWIDHLSPYLRRSGVDVHVLEGGDAELVVEWGLEQPDRPVELLESGFTIHAHDVGMAPR